MHRKFGANAKNNLDIGKNGGLMSKTNQERITDMKIKSIKLTSLLLLLVIIISSLSLASCDYSEYSDFLNALESANGESDKSTSGTDGTNEADEADGTNAADAEDAENSHIGGTVQNGTGNQITINGDNTNSITYAAANGLRSAVSIYCTFEMTYGGSSFYNPRPTTQTYNTTGSGVIYELDENGNAFIVTNHHVVYDADSDEENGISRQIYVYLYGLESEELAISAEYVGGSANYDIAVLSVTASEVLAEAYASGAASAVSIGNSDEVYPGQTTITIGNPSSNELSGISVTSGIVSVDSEYISMTSNTGYGKTEFRVIRTDAPVNSGNSGGGMYNDRGELIGIVNAKISSSDIENIGYALPSNVVRAIADNIIDYCYGKDCESVMRGLLGITLQVGGRDTYFDIDTGLLVRSEEITVYEVSEGGLGENILKAGDIVKSITADDRTVTVTRQHHLIDAMLDVRVGDTVSLCILRDGEEMTVSTIITEDCLAAY